MILMQKNWFIMSSIQHKNGGLFFYLIILTTLFILLQISYLLRLSGFYLGDFQGIASHLEVPYKAIPPLLFFISIQLVLHFLFIVFVWAVALLIGFKLNYSWRKTENIGFGLWGFAVVTAIFANQFYFPNSKFASLTGFLINYWVAGGIFFICFAVVIVATGIAMFGLYKKLPRLLTWSCLSLLVLLLGILGIKNLAANPVVLDAATEKQPNIIIIGIDSLRPDYLGYFSGEKNTPHLDRFFAKSTVFSESLTPIARTFPSWVGILTGRYPKQSGVRTNLQNLSHITSLQMTLPNILRQKGYNTLFATDETRFSNIDSQFGFDAVITPPIGFNDFLLGSINDFPFSNLLVNTRVGRWLFPNSYGNRPVYATYDPNSFLTLLAPTLAKSRNKPLFMAVHFCLPHTPYFWGTQTSGDVVVDNYKSAVHRVDQQVNDFLQLLQKDNVLNHALVIVLSDHGEAMELHGDRVTNAALFVAGAANHHHVIPQFYPPTVEKEMVDQSAGHGTDVLSLPQYRTVLAMRTFGMQANRSGTVSQRVSLLDIKPTILDFLHMNIRQETGKSLKPILMTGLFSLNNNHDFFMETDFSPESIRSVHPETRNVVFEGINYFQIDPKTMRIIVKNSMEQLILSSKQYADVYGEWILALYPQSKNTMIPILVNLNTRQWTNDLNTPFAKSSPVEHMLQFLRRFYGSDLSL